MSDYKPTPAEIKELRERTGAGMLDVRNALAEAGGDREAALRALRESGIAASMGSVGDCYDNAMAESFFATLETELIDRSAWATTSEAKAAVFEYIEVFYNRIRRHSSLGNLSPEQYEERYRSSPAVKAV